MTFYTNPPQDYSSGSLLYLLGLFLADTYSREPNEYKLFCFLICMLIFFATAYGWVWVGLLFVNNFIRHSFEFSEKVEIQPQKIAY